MSPLPRLLAISDRRSLPDGDLLSWITDLAAAAHGVAGGALAPLLAVQLREKDLDDPALYELAVAVRERLPAPLRLIVNGRPDVALAAGADGVHLPSTGLSVAAVAGRWGTPAGGPLLVGVSTHRPEEVGAAGEAGADYATFGPLRPTPSKAGHGPPPGIDGLAAAARHGLPLLALGGVGAGELEEVYAAGAFGASGIRCFADPGEREGTLRRAAELFIRGRARH